MSDIVKDPVPGVPIEKPEVPPKPGQILQGYRVITRPNKIFQKPEPQKMTVMGWASVAILAILFWPATCVPCCMSCSYPEVYQVPVYE